MKAIRSLLLVILLGWSLSGCGMTAQPAATPLGESMKGYELYSWQDGSQWYFAVLVGTNREKTLDEIKAMKIETQDLASLLDGIAAGQYVTWSSKETLSFPPDEIIRQVEQMCKDQGLILNRIK